LILTPAASLLHKWRRDSPLRGPMEFFSKLSLCLPRTHNMLSVLSDVVTDLSVPSRSPCLLCIVPPDFPYSVPWLPLLRSPEVDDRKDSAGGVLQTGISCGIFGLEYLLGTFMSLASTVPVLVVPPFLAAASFFHCRFKRPSSKWSPFFPLRVFPFVRVVARDGHHQCRFSLWDCWAVFLVSFWNCLS